MARSKWRKGWAKVSPSAVALVCAAVLVAVAWGAILASSAESPSPGDVASEPAFDQEPALRTITPLSDSHIYNEGSWFRLTVEAGRVDGYAVGEFASQPGALTDTIRTLVPKVKGSDWVIVQGGTNDLLAAHSPQQALAGVKVLVEAADERAGSVMVALVPPSDTTGPQVIELNRLLTQWAKGQDVPVLDVYSSVAATDGSYRLGLSDDGVHANDRGARMQAQAALPQLRRILD